jgi:ribosomal protein S27AE
MFPDDIVLVDARMSTWLPPATLDQTYMSLDTQRARELWASTTARKLWRTTELPPGFHVDLSKLWSRGASEVGAYDELWRRYGSVTPDSYLREEVGKFYLVAKNLADLRIHQHAVKTAAYWVAQNRQYRVTQREFKARQPSCPKCGTAMKKTTYKMREGDRHRLFACPKDLFLAKITDIVGPTGEAVEW